MSNFYDCGVDCAGFVIPSDKAPEAYHLFDEGAPVKYVIDPHNSTGKPGVE